MCGKSGVEEELAMRRTQSGLVALSLAAGLGLVYGAMASDEPPRPATREAGPGRPRGRLELIDRMINELALSDAQTQGVRDLWAQRTERIRSAGPDQAKRLEAAQWFIAEARKVLTEVQTRKFDAMQLGQLRQRLDLSDEQVEKILALGPQFRQRLDDAAGDATKRREAWTWYEQQVRALLTDEQTKRYDELAGMGRDRVSLVGLVRIDQEVWNLGLSEEQRAKIRDLQAARDKQVKAAFTTFEESLKGVLRADQMERLEQRLKQPPAGGEMRPPGGGHRSGGPGRGTRGGDGPGR
jgi:hypothetical protein